MQLEEKLDGESDPEKQTEVKEAEFAPLPNIAPAYTTTGYVGMSSAELNAIITN